MSLEKSLAQALVREQPERAAAVLERREPAQAAAVLAQGPASEAARVLSRVSPSRIAPVVADLADDRVVELLGCMPIDSAARVTRQIAEPRRELVVGRLADAQARALRALLHFSEGSAGALMDPTALALPEDITAREALARVREAPELTRYNLYVVDRAHLLVGVLNLRELFVARPGARLSDIMTRQPHRLDARLDQAQVVSHPGWREVHALPVVDDGGHYVGAIRYRTLRRLEDALFARDGQDADVGNAMGQVFAAGARGLAEALLAAGPTRTGRT